ncbi:MAG: tRNA preQ1(34) S-adenosylmethionine ribosyltransferase-isomerase QueA [Candidatus Taylorbacteria bacterium]|nr:tRNA preQ1(34) S-adenosylmethionine ribosyltransferase-isomerase QueA [Candidatus Taylorbacteria bacterium]
MKKTSALPQYSYSLPEGFIAREPASPRDSAKLLSYDSKTGRIADLVFRDLAETLPSGALLVINETRVVPARVTLAKKTGGKVEILFYVNSWDGKTAVIEGISDRKLSVGDRLFLDGKELCAVASQSENVFSFSLSISPAKLLSTLEEKGAMPIPKYIKGSPLSERDLKERYQTTFAKNPGSVAAPTASLHFTPELFERLAKRGIEVCRLTLHVGAGTFSPVTEREMSSGRLHRERFIVPRATFDAIVRAKKEGRAVIPVGTTALRAIESIDLDQQATEDIASSTDIFIRKPYAFRVADGLVTNFHVPESSLMCLVDALLESKKAPHDILDLYRHAIHEKYRFFSFGDGMLIT